MVHISQEQWQNCSGRRSALDTTRLEIPNKYTVRKAFYSNSVVNYRVLDLSGAGRDNLKRPFAFPMTSIFTRLNGRTLPKPPSLYQQTMILSF